MHKTTVIDKFGNSVGTVSTSGDHWRHRHDALKHVIHNLCLWAKLPVHLEVLNMFAPVIQQFEQLNEDCDQRQRQGLIPDLFFPESNQLADIKTMACCKTHYPPSRFRHAVTNDAVRVRQGKVNNLYRDKAKYIDEKFNNHPYRDRPGPVGLKLASYGRVRGLICGAFGEGSPDLFKLCDKIAGVAASSRFEDLGAIDINSAKARASRFVYRAIGMEMIRGTAALRNYRMGVILAGSASAKAAASRRKWAKIRWEEEQEAYFYSHSYGRLAQERPW